MAGISQMMGKSQSPSPYYNGPASSSFGATDMPAGLPRPVSAPPLGNPPMPKARPTILSEDSSIPSAAKPVQYKAAQATDSELYDDIRKQSEKYEQGVRMNPNDPTFKDFEKNLPDDLEIIDNAPDTGRGKGESVRVRRKRAPLTS